MVARRRALLGLPADDELSWARATATRAPVQIEGESIEFLIVACGELWIGRGRWQAYVVEIQGERVDVDAIQLKRSRSERARKR